MDEVCCIVTSHLSILFHTETASREQLHSHSTHSIHVLPQEAASMQFISITNSAVKSRIWNGVSLIDGLYTRVLLQWVLKILNLIFKKIFDKNYTVSLQCVLFIIFKTKCLLLRADRQAATLILVWGPCVLYAMKSLDFCLSVC